MLDVTGMRLLHDFDAFQISLSEALASRDDFMIRFRRASNDGGDHGCEGNYRKEMLCG